MSLAAQKLKSTLSKRLLKFSDPTVWHVFSPLAVKSKAVNLGQGFPGWHPPAFVKQALKNAVDEPDFMVHQYARAAGHMKLAQALSQRYATKFKREIDPATEVTVHNGASQALATAMLGLLNPDDEVVVLQPAFDLYFAQAELCGAVVNGVSLETRVNADSKQQEWFLDMKKLEASFTDKTRVFILNTPHNPTGKVFSPAELAEISAILVKFPNIVVLSDEVYDTMVYAPNKHTSIATLPGMWDKTLTINSAGKCFSVTGWKIGWAVGPPHLVASTSTANQWLCTYSRVY
jgi:kynurenine--oxoglutarate transaminase/cysteine-S-conjugate beta-lyase/glutamine--phenylpyruvate transaminase